jgi:serine protease inhibitor
MPRFLLLLSLTILPGCVFLTDRGLPEDADHSRPVNVRQSQSSSDFATRLLKTLADREADQNLIASPFSIQVGLAMCAVGANGDTRKVMTELIDAPANLDEQNRRYAAWLKSINGGDRRSQLITVNALWGQHGYRFHPEFKKTLAQFYHSTFAEVDWA